MEANVPPWEAGPCSEDTDVLAQEGRDRQRPPKSLPRGAAPPGLSWGGMTESGPRAGQP